MEALCRTLEEPSERVSPAVQAIWSRVVRQYAACTPSILAVVGKVVPSACGDQCNQAVGQSPPAIYHDHFAFRTFGVAGLGIASLAGPLQQLGYVQQVMRKSEEPTVLPIPHFLPSDYILPGDASPAGFHTSLTAPCSFCPRLRAGRLRATCLSSTPSG